MPKKLLVRNATRTGPQYYPHNVLSGKLSQIRKTVFHKPTMHPLEIAKILKSQGVETNASIIRTVKSLMRKEGLNLPRLPRKAKWNPKRLAAEKAVEKAILDNPLAPTSQHLKTLEDQGISVSYDGIVNIKTALRKKGVLTESRPRKIERKESELTPAQKELLKKAKHYVAKTLHRIRRGRYFTQEDIEELKSTIQHKLPSWVAAYDPKKGMKFSNWIIQNIQFQGQNFVREKVRQLMGVKNRDVQNLFSLLLRLDKGMQLEEAVKEVGISKETANSLLDAYNHVKKQLSLDELV